MTVSRLLLCTDLDRTLLPNGDQAESVGARDAFARFTARPEVRLVYVTGRDPDLVDEAIATWDIPEPDLLIADVGTTIAARESGRWQRWTRWDAILAADWSHHSRDDLQAVVEAAGGLKLQPPSRQSRFKLSYDTFAGAAGTAVAGTVRRLLDSAGVRANVVWSEDETVQQGLLDILPAAASKRTALEFVMTTGGYGSREVLFAGDSGNDLDVLTSPIPAVLVGNATAGVREEARQRATAAKEASSLYCARGGVLGMNGHYAAGILEGVLHFYPEWTATLEEIT